MVLYQKARGRKLISVTLRDGSKGVCSPDCVAKLVDLEDKMNLQVWTDLRFRGDSLYVRDYEVREWDYNRDWGIVFSLAGWKKEGSIWTSERHGVKFPAITMSLFETFELGEYGEFPLRGKEVVDVGANMGDTAVFFASRGASKVIAYEPIPKVYQLALESVRLNGYEGRVQVHNCAIGSKEGEVEVPADLSLEESLSFTSLAEGGKRRVRVPLVTLGHAMARISEPYLLKMDCEGCEYDVILNSPGYVGEFQTALIEHHAVITGINVSVVLEKLRELGFNCDLVDSQFTGYPRNMTGLLVCEKRR